MTMVLHWEALRVATMAILLLAMTGWVRASNAISLDTGVRSVLGLPIKQQHIDYV